MLRTTVRQEDGARSQRVGVLSIATVRMHWARR